MVPERVGRAVVEWSDPPHIHYWTGILLYMSTMCFIKFSGALKDNREGSGHVIRASLL